jgi:hypothetical protein
MMTEIECGVESGRRCFEREDRAVEVLLFGRAEERVAEADAEDR